MDERAWRKSSYSAQKTDCIEVAPLPGATAVRDSTNPDGGELHVSHPVWRSFVRGVAGHA